MALNDQKAQDNPLIPKKPMEIRTQRIKDIVESYKKNVKDFWVLYLHAFIAVNTLFGSMAFWYFLANYGTTN